MYLKQVKLTNFKKFRNAEFNFNRGSNIIIGHNGVGKSSILQAIDIGLNQRGNGEWRNGSEYGTLLNRDSEKNFLDNDQPNKIASSLPKIKIELFFADTDTDIRSHIFNGSNNSTKKLDYGLSFTYEFDDRFYDEYDELVKKTDLTFIPFEFYQARWELFSGQPYSFRKNPFKSILIDTDKINGDSYKAFTRQFFSTLDSADQHELSLKLKKHISNFNEEIELSPLMDKHLGVDPNRLVVQESLEVYDSKDNKLLLRDMGSGTENIIKTRLALSNKKSRLVLFEEPENHLSFDLSRTQINEIKGADKDNRQIIVSTHSPLIVSKLSLENLKWLNKDGELVSFKNITKETSNFFLKADNIDVLQVVLANKVILVEGATEYIIMHDILEKIFNENPDQLGIHVVSMGGNYYKRFKEISSITKNKILVITDNDESEKRIEEAKENSNAFFHVSMPQSIDEFTFEVSLYNANKKFFNDVNRWKYNQGKTVWKKHEGLDKPLVWLLEHKAAAAFEYTNKFKNGELIVPDYITEGITWLLE